MFSAMTLSRYLILYFALSLGAFSGAASVKRSNESYVNGSVRENTSEDEEMFSSEYWWESTKYPKQVKLIEEEIMNDLSNMDWKQKQKIYDELKRQKVKSLVETDTLSPLNVVELKAVQKSIRTSSGILPTIRNKRTLNFLLFAAARAMGYALIPRNPDAQLFPLHSNPCRGNSPRPPPPPPPPPHHTTPSPPPPTIPPNQIDANTIRYPYRPSQQIPLLQFAPLPPGVTVPYPPLLQWPSDPCSPPTKPPPPCAPPTNPPPPCPPPTKPPVPCSKPSTWHPPPPPSSPPLPPPPPPKSSKHTPLTLEYDYPVKIQIFNNVKKFLPASGAVFSGNPSNTVQKLEEYEHLDEQGEKEDHTQLTGPNIFRGDEEDRPYGGETYLDGQDEIREELYGSSRESADEEDPELEPMRRERFYERRMVPQSSEKTKKTNYNLIDEADKEREYFKTAKAYGERVSSGEKQEKKVVLKRVIVRKPTARLVDENGNEYVFATSAVHDIQKRDLQDFEFIRKYKEMNGEPEDEHYRGNESPPGRTTTSIKKIEVKKFVVNKSEDDPVEYHEKNERHFDEKPEKVIEPEPQQEKEEHGGEDERSNYGEYEPPPEYEGRREMENELARELETEEEERPKIFDRPPPGGGGINYVTKTVTKYVGGGRETIKIVPLYKVIHAPPPPPRRIVHHHHHHRIPVYPKIIVKTSGPVKRRPPVVAHFGNAGNVLLVTIRERSG